MSSKTCPETLSVWSFPVRKLICPVRSRPKVCLKKNSYTFAIVYSSKCITIFLKPTVIDGQSQTKCVIVRSHQGLFWGPSKFSIPLLWDFLSFRWLLLPTNSCWWQKFLHPTLHQIVGTFALFSSCVKTILKANIYCTFFDGLRIH